MDNNVYFSSIDLKPPHLQRIANIARTPDPFAEFFGITSVTITGAHMVGRETRVRKP